MLIRGERALNAVRPLIAKARECGVDCSNFEAGDHDLSQFFATARRVFWPDTVVPPTDAGVKVPPE
jgi:hypothetical protein